MAALTKSDMADMLFEELGLNKREAKEIVEMFFEEIRASLESNEQVKLSGFGNFELRDKGERPGRNPKTGELIYIPEKNKVRFRSHLRLEKRSHLFTQKAEDLQQSIYHQETLLAVLFLAIMEVI